MHVGAGGGIIHTESRPRNWISHLDPDVLTVHNLNRAFGEEQAFCDAVSGYLLSAI